MSFLLHAARSFRESKDKNATVDKPKCHTSGNFTQYYDKEHPLPKRDDSLKKVDITKPPRVHPPKVKSRNKPTSSGDEAYFPDIVSETFYPETAGNNVVVSSTDYVAYFGNESDGSQSQTNGNVKMTRKASFYSDTSSDDVSTTTDDTQQGIVHIFKGLSLRSVSRPVEKASEMSLKSNVINKENKGTPNIAPAEESMSLGDLY